VLISKSGGGGGNDNGHGTGKDDGHGGGTGVVAYGDPEVYLKIIHQDDQIPDRFLSAPLTTSIEVYGLVEIELHTLFWITVSGWKKCHYQALVNAHLIYEEIEPKES
jgi:hypothetical protein